MHNVDGHSQPPAATSAVPSTQLNSVAEIDTAIARMRAHVKNTDLTLASIHTLETRLHKLIDQLTELGKQQGNTASGGGTEKEEKESVGVVTRRRSKAMKTEKALSEAEIKKDSKGKGRARKASVRYSKDVQEYLDGITAGIKGVKEELEILEEKVFKADSEESGWVKSVIDDLGPEDTI